jgi:hypothetical protein
MVNDRGDAVGSPRWSARYAAAVGSVTSVDPAVDVATPVKRSLASRLRISGSTSLSAREVRVAGAAMLGVAAVRPLVPVEFVPPCPLRTLTGIPCPMCGMTRGVTSLVNGDFAHALLMNPASYLAVALAIVLLVQWRMKRVVVPVWLIAVMLAVMWTWQLFKYATGRPL